MAEERKKLERIPEVERNEDCPLACLKYSFPRFLQYSAMESLSEHFLPTKLCLLYSPVLALSSTTCQMKHQR